VATDLRISRVALYTFYLCKSDGGAATFSAVELAADRDITPNANRLLADHPSAAYVSVWESDRKVAEVGRELVSRHQVA
jgi:hypothetical protein